MNVPMRQMEVVQADDGRRIEVFKKIGEVPQSTRTDEEQQQQQPQEYAPDECLYIGVVHIMTNLGPKEIKFQIPDIQNVEEGFAKFYELADQTMKDIEEKIKQAEQQNQIVTAPAELLNELPKPNDGIITP